MVEQARNGTIRSHDDSDDGRQQCKCTTQILCTNLSCFVLPTRLSRLRTISSPKTGGDCPLDIFSAISPSLNKSECYTQIEDIRAQIRVVFFIGTEFAVFVSGLRRFQTQHQNVHHQPRTTTHWNIGVSIPRQSRGLYVVSRSKRLLGSLARPQYVGRLKAAHGYPTRPGFGLRRSSEYNFVPDTWERMPHSILLIHLRALRSPIVVHRWGSVRVLGGSRSKFRRWAPGARLQEMSNFCCLPGRAGGSPLLV